MPGMAVQDKEAITSGQQLHDLHILFGQCLLTGFELYTDTISAKIRYTNGVYTDLPHQEQSLDCYFKHAVQARTGPCLRQCLHRY